MKIWMLLPAAAVLLLACAPKRPLYRQITAQPVPYDADMATQLGADEYGMKSYVMAFLKRGPNRSQDSLTAANLQRAHLENINRLAEAGQLVLAGPFLDNGELRGISKKFAHRRDLTQSAGICGICGKNLPCGSCGKKTWII